MKQFNLEEYKQMLERGENPKIVTRDGKSARVICTDRLTDVINGVVSRRVIALVRFDGCESPIMYTDGGRFVGNKDNEYDLFFVEDKEETLYEFESFERVLVRDCEFQEWHARLLEMVDDLEHHKYITTCGESWKYCIPYKGNEHLLGTTKTPKL